MNDDTLFQSGTTSILASPQYTRNVIHELYFNSEIVTNVPEAPLLRHEPFKTGWIRPQITVHDEWI